MKDIVTNDFFEHIPERVALFFESDDLILWPTKISSFFESIVDSKIESHIPDDVQIQGNVHIGKNCTIESGAVIHGPTIIGDNVNIRAHAYIRGNVYVGNNSVIGHCTELVRSIIFDDARLDHMNYVGDSILGHHAHLGAGAKIANLRFDERDIEIDSIQLGQNKYGVILGDRSQLGVNVSLGPGMLLKKGTWVPSNDQRSSGIYSKENI